MTRPMHARSTGNQATDRLWRGRDLEIDRPTAWRRVGATALLLWLVLGLGGFGLGAHAVHAAHGESVHAAFLLGLIFTAGSLLLVAVIWAWQRRLGGTMRDLGWGAPTTRRAVLLGVLFGLAWTALSYGRGGNPLDTSWQRPFMILLAPAIVAGEEVTRAFLMTQLHRAGVGNGLQIAAGGVVMASYHGLLGAHYTVLFALASVVMFTLLSALYVAGRRSLTPVLVGHALTHLLGDPALLQGILQGIGFLGG